MKKRLILPLIFILVILSGCSSKSGLEVSGSTSVAPVMTKLINEYKNKSDEHINLNADGSSAGIKGAASGISDIGMASRDLKDNEKEGLETTIMAIDAIGIIVNEENPAKNLTLKQLEAIYKGDIKNWKDVGGEDLPIVLVSRENGSGTRSAFEEMTNTLNTDGSSTVDKLNPVIVNSTGATIENVRQKRGAIGYVSIGSLEEGVHVLNIDNIEPNEENIRNKKYSIARNFNLVYKDPSKETKEFLEFIMSKQGQKIVEEEGFVSVK
ncbi:MAG: phosphate ABC transporter substrate-binding protein [Erysipelotrichales bacterium]